MYDKNFFRKKFLQLGCSLYPLKYAILLHFEAFHTPVFILKKAKKSLNLWAFQVYKSEFMSTMK